MDFDSLERKKSCCEKPCCQKPCCGNSCCPAKSEDSFASLENFGDNFAIGSQISLFPVISDTTGQITSANNTTLVLEPGYYLISYKVSVLFDHQAYMQVVPSYNGASHLDTGIYFMTGETGAGRASAAGSAHFILHAPSRTTFTLTYSGSSPGFSGALNLTILKLKRN